MVFAVVVTIEEAIGLFSILKSFKLVISQILFEVSFNHGHCSACHA